MNKAAIQEKIAQLKQNQAEAELQAGICGLMLGNTAPVMELTVVSYKLGYVSALIDMYEKIIEEASENSEDSPHPTKV